jgi:hypothetical protein
MGGGSSKEPSKGAAQASPAVRKLEAVESSKKVAPPTSEAVVMTFDEAEVKAFNEQRRAKEARRLLELNQQAEDRSKQEEELRKIAFDRRQAQEREWDEFERESEIETRKLLDELRQSTIRMERAEILVL